MVGLDGSAIFLVQKRPVEGASIVKLTKNVTFPPLIKFLNHGLLYEYRQNEARLLPLCCAAPTPHLTSIIQIFAHTSLSTETINLKLLLRHV